MNSYPAGRVRVRFLADRLPDGREIDSARAWMSKLMARLDTLGRKYDEANAAPHLETEMGESRQVIVAETVRAIIDALGEVPKFTDNRGMVPLHSLLGALLDLHIGKIDPLLEPREVVAAPTTISNGFVRRHAILCVKIMSSTQEKMKETPACRHVAGVMRHLGYTGRKGGLFPVSTLTDWLAVLTEHDHRFLNKRLAEIHADKGDLLDHKFAERLVVEYLSHPLMLSKKRLKSG